MERERPVPGDVIVWTSPEWPTTWVVLEERLGRFRRGVYSMCVIEGYKHYRKGDVYDVQLGGRERLWDFAEDDFTRWARRVYRRNSSGVQEG